MRLRTHLSGLALLGLLTTATPLHAVQQVAVAMASPPENFEAKAQLGIRGVGAVVREGRQLRTVMVVTGTIRNSPAHRSGLVPGDSIVAINGTRLSVDSWWDFRLGLRPGDEVRLTLLREGEAREVLLEADPVDERDGPPFHGWSMTSVEIPEEVQVDVASIQERIERAFRDARVRIAEEPQQFVANLRADSTFTATYELLRDARREGSRFTIQTDDRGRGWVIASSPSAGEAPETPEAPSAVATARLDTIPAIQSVHVTPNGREVVFIRPDSLRSVIRLSPTGPLPADFMRMAGEEADSLTGRYATLRSELETIERQRLERERQLLEEARRQAEALRANDARLNALAQRNRMLAEELVRLQAELAEARERDRASRARTTDRDRVESVSVPNRADRARELSRLTRNRMSEAAGAASASRWSARVVGENMVMGAQLRTLTPKLADYFEAERGVLVVEIVDGSPAARAGILPGDVIVRAGRHQIHDVDGLRKALSEGRPGLRFGILRQGDRLTVRLPN